MKIVQGKRPIFQCTVCGFKFYTKEHAQTCETFCSTKGACHNEMAKYAIKEKRKTLISLVVATTITAICCFTPVLVVLLVALGLSRFIPYLDVVLFPLLAILVVSLVTLLYKKRV